MLIYSTIWNWLINDTRPSQTIRQQKKDQVKELL